MAFAAASAAATHSAGARAALRARDPTWLSLTELAAGRAAGEWSATELVDHFLARIRRLNGALERFDDNGRLNAFVRLYEAEARRSAALFDLDARGTTVRTLDAWHGVPIALKDVFAIADQPLTIGAPEFASYRSPRDSHVHVQLRASGGIVLGHTQSQRLISGVETPQTGNPWNLRWIAGGSSGGSAAAVAAGLVPLAMGTETDGSLVYPALCCGVMTLKPSHGLVSLSGVVPGVPSLDVAGPLARSARDCLAALVATARHDPEDPQSVAAVDAKALADAFHRAVAARRPLAGVRLLVLEDEPYLDGATDELVGTGLSAVHPSFRQALGQFVAQLKELGADVRGAPGPAAGAGRDGPFRSASPALGGLSPFKVLAVTDELHHSIPNLVAMLAGASAPARRAMFRRLSGREDTPYSDQLRADAAKISTERIARAVAAREALRDTWRQWLVSHGGAGCIYLEVGAPLPERNGVDGTAGPSPYRGGVVPNDLGWPVASLPVTYDRDLRWPISLQIMAPRWHDAELLRWCDAWQQRHPDTMLRRPPIA